MAPAEFRCLDASAGLRMMHTNKDNPLFVYLDQRGDTELAKDKADYEVQRGRRGTKKWKPKISTVKGDFRKLDFPDEYFQFIVWDPPHLKWLGAQSLFRKRFGALDAETWPDDIKRGAAELWRVLKVGGVLVFKWNDSQISHKKVIALFPAKPIIQNITGGGKKGHGKFSETTWHCFLKTEAS